MYIYIYITFLKNNIKLFSRERDARAVSKNNKNKTKRFNSVNSLEITRIKIAESFKDTWYKVFSGYSSIARHPEKFAQRSTDANTHKNSRNMTLERTLSVSMSTWSVLEREKCSPLILYPSNSRGPSDHWSTNRGRTFSYSTDQRIDEFVGAW